LSDTAASAFPGELFGRSFALSGPAEKVEAARLPLRGDLAHIRLAGRYFVPHYAVPMSRVLPNGAELLSSIKADAVILAKLPSGAEFDVLDVAGPWAWGEYPATGLVGYVAVTQFADLKS
jgi:hypothetical protein